MDPYKNAEPQVTDPCQLEKSRCYFPGGRICLASLHAMLMEWNLVA